MRINRKNTVGAVMLLILTALMIICTKKEPEMTKGYGIPPQITDTLKRQSIFLLGGLSGTRRQGMAKVQKRLETLAECDALFADYPDISEDIKKQLIIFADNSDMWRDVYSESGGEVFYTVYDLDEDGQLELIMETEQGRLHFVWHDYYRADITDKTVITLERGYMEGEASSHIMNEPELSAYEDAESGNIYYAVTKWGWDPDSHNTTYLDGFFYLEDNVLKREDIRYRLHYAETDVDEYYAPTPSKDSRIALDKTAYEKLYTDFVQSMILKKVRMSWFELGGNENLTQTEILKMLIESYVGGAGLASKE